MPSSKPVEQWTESELELLVQTGVEESCRVEYKREIDLSGKGKKEAAKDISAMANAEGGVVVYGIDEKQDGNNAGIPNALFPMKEQTLIDRLEAVLLDAISPRLSFTIRRIDAHDDGFYAVVTVPQSYASVHMVTLGGDNRYYKRRNHMSSPMTEDEVRQAYERISRSAESVESRFERTIFELPDDWRGIQIISMPIVQWGRMIDSRRITARELDALFRELQPQMRPHLTLMPALNYGPDGFSDLREGDGGPVTGIRLQYDGGLSYLYQFRRDGDRTLPSLTILDRVHDCLLFFGHVYRMIGYLGPVKAYLILHGARGTELGLPRRFWIDQVSPDRNELIVSVDTNVESMIASTMAGVREIMDYVFNSYGMSECIYFEKDRDILNSNIG